MIKWKSGRVCDQLTVGSMQLAAWENATGAHWGIENTSHGSGAVPCRTLAEAKRAAEKCAREILRDALAELALPVGQVTHAVIYGHHRSAVADHPTVELAESLDAAADVVERVAKSYGFTFDGSALRDEEGNESEDIEVQDGRLIRFSHSDGEGPVALTVEVE